jgi:hypothetical protein
MCHLNSNESNGRHGNKNSKKTINLEKCNPMALLINNS